MTSVRMYDAADRVIQYTSFSQPGTVKERQVSTYDDNGRLTQQVNRNGADAVIATINRSYDQAGNLTQYSVNVSQGTPYTNTFTYEYLRFEGYKESVVRGTSTFFQPGNTTHTYDRNGNLVSVVDQFQAAKNRTFIVTPQGQILRKTENNQTQHYYYVNGQPLGSSGGSGDLANADFDYNYTPVSERYPAATPTSYVVNEGDTLRGIALAVYGDSKLWYLIADANGITDATAPLTAGKTLTIPNKITNLHNDSATFKPYHPGEIIGDTTPTLPEPPPPPQPDEGCGVLGQIIVIIVTIVVAIFATEYLGYWMETGWAAAFGAAAGSLAGQTTAVALGMQDGIDWGAVAAAGLTAGLTQGAPAGAKWYVHVGKAALNNVMTQGINILTGQQEAFDWRGIVAAAIAAPITASLTKDLAPMSNAGSARGFTWEGFGADVATGFIKGAVSQGARILVDGKGKMSWANIAADAFGNAIGQGIAAQALREERFERREKKWEAIFDANMERERRGLPRLYYKDDYHGNPVLETPDELRARALEEKDPVERRKLEMAAKELETPGLMSKAAYIKPEKIRRWEALSPDDRDMLPDDDDYSVIAKLQHYGWRLKGAEGYGALDDLAAQGDRLQPQGAFQTWTHEESNRAFLAFKGSGPARDWWDDLFHSGRRTWDSIARATEQTVGSLWDDGYTVLTAGHSLGGALAQNAALKFGLDGYAFDALPLSSRLLRNLAGENGSIEQDIADYNDKHIFTRFVTGGDVATTWYDDIWQGQYLGGPPEISPTGFENRQFIGALGLSLLGALPWNWTVGAWATSAYLHRMAQFDHPAPGASLPPMWKTGPDGELVYSP